MNSDARARFQQQGSPWRVLAVVLVAALAGGAILAGFLLAPRFVVRQEQVSERDRALLIVAGDFLQWMPGLVVHNDREQTTKTRHDEATVRLAYLYDALGEEPPAYVRCEVVAVQDAAAAKDVYLARIGELLPFDRVEQSAKDDEFAWGNESQFGELVQDGGVCGRYFHCRKHDRVYSLLVYGVNTGYSQDFIELLTPALEQLESW